MLMGPSREAVLAQNGLRHAGRAADPVQPRHPSAFLPKTTTGECQQRAEGGSGRPWPNVKLEDVSAAVASTRGRRRDDVPLELLLAVGHDADRARLMGRKGAVPPGEVSR